MKRYICKKREKIRNLNTDEYLMIVKNYYFLAVLMVLWFFWLKSPHHLVTHTDMFMDEMT